MPAEIISLIDISGIVFIERTAARVEQSAERRPLSAKRKTNGLTIERKFKKSSFFARTPRAEAIASVSGF
ncbi:hypothetical protein [Trinickia acidisoli]|uniref:hypothetical protein n=1 Tax=Trinickia acidisoli TaxID=2767482 RepID=UPI001A8E5427|nr:hypothetical protein [Trinickia acidisoli]